MIRARLQGSGDGRLVGSSKGSSHVLSRVRHELSIIHIRIYLFLLVSVVLVF